ncbi:hypothetical protein ACOME3_008715 [Neoechinorhynchus agilis]
MSSVSDSQTDRRSKILFGVSNQRLGRQISLVMLIEDEIIDPGAEVLSIDYRGKTYKADLLHDGKIIFKNTLTGKDECFNTPSAWAIYCKRLQNPGRRSGCGWGSVKYKGKKLDYWKLMWCRHLCVHNDTESDEPEQIVCKSTSDEIDRYLMNGTLRIAHILPKNYHERLQSKFGYRESIDVHKSIFQSLAKQMKICGWYHAHTASSILEMSKFDLVLDSNYDSLRTQSVIPWIAVILGGSRVNDKSWLLQRLCAYFTVTFCDSNQRQFTGPVRIDQICFSGIDKDVQKFNMDMLIEDINQCNHEFIESLNKRFRDLAVLLDFEPALLPKNAHELFHDYVREILNRLKTQRT